METINFDIFEDYRRMREEDVILSLKGMVSQNILAGLVEMIKKKFIPDCGHERIVKKMYAVFIEMVQNIIHHSADRITSEKDKKNIGKGIIFLREIKDHFVISTGNLTENTKIAGIRTLLDTVNDMEKEELHRLYQQKLRAPKREGKIEPGAALVNIVRKSGNSIIYDINSIDQNHSFLTLSAKIAKEEGGQ